MKNKLYIIFINACLLASAVPGRGQLGYRLEQSVIAGGGGTSVSPMWAVGGTIGQAAAAGEIIGLPYRVTSGYWVTTTDFAPVGTLTISGRVCTAGGRGITNAVITITGGSLATPIIDRSGRSGAYSIPGLTAGQQYVVTVQTRRFTFTQSSVTLTPQNDLTNVDFTSVN